MINDPVVVRAFFPKITPRFLARTCLNQITAYAIAGQTVSLMWWRAAADMWVDAVFPSRKR